MMHGRSENFFKSRWEAALAASHPRRLSLRTIFYVMATLLCVSGLGGASANAQSINQAALVVVHGDGRVLTRCVDFAETQISGLELLQRSGLDLNLEASSMGAAICRIDGEGCTFPQQSCFCQCEGASCIYWSYWRWENGDWRYSQLGASNSSVLPGSMDSWVWGAGTVDSAPKPPLISFASICAPVTPTETPSLTPTPTESWTLPAATPSETPTLLQPTSTNTSTPTNTAMPLPATAGLQSPVLPANDAPTPVAIAAPTASPVIPPHAVGVPTASPPVIEFFIIDRREIQQGEIATLTWRTHNANMVHMHASGRSVLIEGEGSMRVAPPQNTTYQIVASGAGGSTSSALTVIVRPKPVAPPQQTAVAPAQSLLTEPMTVTVSTDAPAIHVESSSVDLPGIQSPPMATPTSTATATSTLAPVALAPLTVIPDPAAPAVVPQADAQITVTPLLMLVGLAVLIGLPLLGVATLLLVWLIHRPQ